MTSLERKPVCCLHPTDLSNLELAVHGDSRPREDASYQWNENGLVRSCAHGALGGGRGVVHAYHDIEPHPTSLTLHYALPHFRVYSTCYIDLANSR